MIPHLLVIILNLASFGGQVIAQIETPSLETCLKVRRAVVKALGGNEGNVNGTISDCRPKD